MEKVVVMVKLIKTERVIEFSAGSAEQDDVRRVIGIASLFTEKAVAHIRDLAVHGVAAPASHVWIGKDASE
jgi:hypothetical protein